MKAGESRVHPSRWSFRFTLLFAAIAMIGSQRAWGQAPTIEVPIESSRGRPGSDQSLLGGIPGADEKILGIQPGRDEQLLGRIGTAAPRVPTSITMPGQSDQPRQAPRVGIPEALPVPRAPLYGTFALPEEDQGEGPEDGLTLDAAIDLLIQNNPDLKSKSLEIPQARADILTASLRANPILYADSQMIPYGSFSRERAGGPTQYDLNISHPLDYSRKRRARTDYATKAMMVIEAQYQDAVRVEIGNLYTAFVEVLSARQTVRYTRASVDGLKILLEKTRLLYERDIASRADVNDVQAQLRIAEIGVLDAEENHRKAARALGAMLFLSPDESETLEVKGSISDDGPSPPPIDQLFQMALGCRPDVAAFRLGLQVAESGVRLAKANRYQDAYVLYQPYTYQDNRPFDTKSATSWALGITVPLPVYNRNQGNIERARMNVTQAQIEISSIERRVLTEVKQAAKEYEISKQIVDRIRNDVLPVSKSTLEDRLTLFQDGEENAVSYIQAQRAYNDNVKAYHDTVVRHRRAMLMLNTAVGQRILP